MKDLMDLAHQVELEDQVAAITVSGGFPYSDVPFAGMSIVVTTNDDLGLAQEKACKLRDFAWKRHREFVAHNRPVDEAVKEAISAQEGPVILVDVADNVGGGAPGDGTILLKSLLEHKAQGAAVVIADPEAVSAAIASRIGKEVNLDQKDYTLIQEWLKNRFVTTDTESSYNRGVCPAGTEKIYITPYGDIYPCPFIQTRKGNILENDFIQLWKQMNNKKYGSCIGVKEKD